MSAAKDASLKRGHSVRVAFHEYQSLLEQGLRELGEEERKAIFLRFWSPHTIDEIARHLNMNWRSANELIEQAVRKIRHVMLEGTQEDQGKKNEMANAAPHEFTEEKLEAETPRSESRDIPISRKEEISL